MLKIIECPRDAMQGLHEFIPTEQKINYINSLLKVGFDTIDFGSFVSPKAIPQMRDTHEVLANLELAESKSKLLAIVANQRGVDDALKYEVIQYLGFPLSISETFQQRNTRKSIEEALKNVATFHEQCEAQGKTLVTYISMGFGNPYDEPYSSEIVMEFVNKLVTIGVNIISLADTIGSSEPELIDSLFSAVIPAFPQIEFGAHFHSTPEKAAEKIRAAYHAGCRRFDGAMGGMGGCPMAKDDLTGNLATETMIQVFQEEQAPFELDLAAFAAASQLKLQIFG
ncbi:MAG: hydroxymethylglutaryl-CoA lyase [Flammeovirgaceae bacterium]